MANVAFTLRVKPLNCQHARHSVRISPIQLATRGNRAERDGYFATADITQIMACVAARLVFNVALWRTFLLKPFELPGSNFDASAAFHVCHFGESCHFSFISKYESMKDINLNVGGVLGALLCAGVMVAIFFMTHDPAEGGGRYGFSVLALFIGGVAGNYVWDFVFKKR